MKRAAFTLVELAIVLVIIGLLVGGVLVGRDLVLGANVQAIVAEERHYATAATAFHDKYSAYPGDMKNATAYWGGLNANGADAACQAIPALGTDTSTCNGNGDGMVYTNVGPNDELLRFWQHLSNAGMVQGHYIGTIGSNAGYSGVQAVYVNGINVPLSRIPLNGYWLGLNGLNYSAGSSGRFAGNYGNALWIQPFVLTPTQAYDIDRKADDGLPGSGFAIAYKGNSPTQFPCTTRAGFLPGADSGALYNVQDENIDCYLAFVRAF